MSNLAGLPVDAYDRKIVPDHIIPDPLDHDSAFAQWRGATCGPWSIAADAYFAADAAEQLGVLVRGGRMVSRQTGHAAMCRDGWVRSGDWWFGCQVCCPRLNDFHDGKTDPWVLWTASVSAPEPPPPADRCPAVNGDGLPCQKRTSELNDGTRDHGGGHMFASDQVFERLTTCHVEDARAALAGEPFALHAPADCRPGCPHYQPTFDAGEPHS